MWKVCVPLFSLLLVAWFLILCMIRSDLTKTNGKETYPANYNNSISFNKNDTFGEKGQEGVRKIKQHIPRFMLELYENGVKDGCCRQNGSLPDIVKSVIPKNAVIMEYEQKYKDYKDNHLLIFDVPETNVDEDFINAELKILSIVDIEANTLDGLQKVVKISIYDDKEQKIIPLQKTNAIYKNNTWLSFNLTKAIKEILTKKEKFLKLVISIKAYLSYFEDNLAKFRLSLLPVEEDFEHDYPVLLLTYSTIKNETTNDETNTIKRRRRNIVDDDYIWDEKGAPRRNRKSKNTCRRRSLYVDFSEIQYDTWIVQPSGYEAYQCHGRCFYPLAEHLSPTKHAIIQALLHSVDPSKTPKACCVPTTLSSISVLYVDDKGILTYRYAYKDMVVTECGCR